jgi:cardiolipin synthase
MIEDEPFAGQMERMYLEDLRHTTEIVLDSRKGRKLRASQATAATTASPKAGGSARRATAAALRISNAVAAAVIDSRELEPVEARLLLMGSAILLTVAALVAAFPAATGFFIALLAGWLGLSLLYRAYTLRRQA